LSEALQIMQNENRLRKALKSVLTQMQQ